MQKIDSKFNLQGKANETISITVNGAAQPPGVLYTLDTKNIGGTFTLDSARPTVMLAVNIDFNQAAGDDFEIVVTGDVPGSFESKFSVPRAGAFRTVQYRFQVV